MRKTSMILLILVLIINFTFAQKVNYKKDLKPYIESNYTGDEAFQKAKLFHAQNTNSDFSISDKALLLQYDNVYQTRLYLSTCYGVRGEKKLSIEMMDTCVFYARLAAKLYDDVKTNEFINKMLNAKKAVIDKVVTNKNVEEERQKQVQEKIKYELKTSTATWLGARLYQGYCQCGMVTQNSNMINKLCGIRPELANETFNISYQLGKVELPGGKTMKGEGYVLKSISISNSETDKMFLSTYTSKLESDCDSLLGEVQKSKQFEYYLPHIEKLVSKRNTLSSDDDFKSYKSELKSFLEQYYKNVAKIQTYNKKNGKLGSRVKKSNFLWWSNEEGVLYVHGSRFTGVFYEEVKTSNQAPARIKWEHTYKDGLVTYKKFYYTNGKVKSEGAYSEGEGGCRVKSGTWRYTDEYGNTSTEVFTSKKCPLGF